MSTDVSTKGQAAENSAESARPSDTDTVVNRYKAITDRPIVRDIFASLSVICSIIIAVSACIIVSRSEKQR